MPSFRPEESNTIESSCKYDLQLWQIEDFLKNSQEKFSVREVARYRSSEISKGFDAEKGETIEFDIVILSDGSTAKANITVKPNEDGKGSGLEFSLDTSKLHTEEQAKAAFGKFHEMAIQTLLKFTPAGEDINLFSRGSNRWSELADKDLQETIKRHEQDFREKGINTVSMNGQMILDLRLDAEASLDDLKSGEQKRAKPWDVPRGAPDKTR